MAELKKIIFVGGLWYDDDEMIDISKGPVQFAANQFQKSIITGLDQTCATPTTIVTGLFVGSYPRRCKRSSFGSGIFNHTEKANHTDYRVGFCNFTVIKHFSLARSLTKTVEGLLDKEDEVDGICVCGYAMTYSTVKALMHLKARFPGICTCLIVPDLPQYMDLSSKKHRLRSAIKTIVNRRLFAMVSTVDCFTVLTKYMCEQLPVKGKPFCVVEGIAPAIEERVVKKNQERNTIVYTGSLSGKYGITELVDAFVKLNRKDLYLDIYGYGDSVPYILQQAQLNQRIRYWGNIDNKAARKAQQEALLLVNPRRNNEEYTKYSFPSKTLEYLASGTPVLMCKLPGVPDEYYEYVFSFKEDLYESLNQVVSLPIETLKEKGREGMLYASTKKNARIQSGKIVSMLETALKNNINKK